MMTSPLAAASTKGADDPSFTQRRFFTRTRYQLVTDGVEVTTKTLFDSSRYRVPFEHIAGQAEEVAVSSRRWFWGMIGLMGLALYAGVLELQGEDVERGAYLVWATLGALAGAEFFLSRKTFLIYGAEYPRLVLYKDMPDSTSLAAFMEQVQQRKQAFLLTRYLHGNQGTAADAIHKLAWLVEQGAITPDEYEVLKGDVVGGARTAGLPISLN